MDRLSGLKDWQPLLASIIVFCGALIAYQAAMAKVKLDRELAQRAILRSRAALYLRLQFALQRLSATASKIAANLETRYGNKTIGKLDLLIGEPPELSEAWNALDLFSTETTECHKGIKSILAKWNVVAAEVPADEHWETNRFLPMDPPWKIRDFAKELVKACDSTDVLLAEGAAAAVTAIN
jgi:hypothetical protein